MLVWEVRPHAHRPVRLTQHPQLAGHREPCGERRLQPLVATRGERAELSAVEHDNPPTVARDQRCGADDPLSSTSTGPHSEVIDNGGYSFANVPPTIVRVIAPNSGFHWGDAGIGAVGALALAILGLGSAIAVSQRRARRSRRSSAVTS